MTEKNYAFIKNNVVINTVVFDDPTVELLAYFKEEYQLDDIVPVIYENSVGSADDDTKSWPPQPYPSWIKNEELREWEPPISYPTVEKGSDENYVWDENTISWLLLPPSN